MREPYLSGTWRDEECHGRYRSNLDASTVPNSRNAITIAMTIRVKHAATLIIHSAPLAGSSFLTGTFRHRHAAPPSTIVVTQYGTAPEESHSCLTVSIDAGTTMTATIVSTTSNTTPYTMTDLLKPVPERLEVWRFDRTEDLEDRRGDPVFRRTGALDVRGGVVTTLSRGDAGSGRGQKKSPPPIAGRGASRLFRLLCLSRSAWSLVGCGALPRRLPEERIAKSS